MTRVAIVGGSGYVGGELLRLLLQHPHVEVTQITSARNAGNFVATIHPNLRTSVGGFGAPSIKFIHPDALKPCDLIFLALPHGEAAKRIEHYAALAPLIIDCSADFRLQKRDLYTRWYGGEHPAPGWLERFVYGLPERNRERLRAAHYATGVGCNATAATLALGPLADAGLLSLAVVDLKVGSSEGGAAFSLASHHPERSGAVRTFKATGHRHQAEVIQALGEGFELHFTATAIELVRGVLATCHCFLNTPLSERELWQLYRQSYVNEPFIRLVRSRTGIYRLPEPKIVAGTNFCDIGFEADSAGRRVVVLAALDNLMKGAAGSAVQSMNVMMGWEETAGLSFVGLHPL